MSHRAKLTAVQVRAIRRLHKPGGKWTQLKLAVKYGVSQTAISLLLNGKTYVGVL